jgi:hypothetical protein
MSRIDVKPLYKDDVARMLLKMALNADSDSVNTIAKIVSHITNGRYKGELDDALYRRLRELRMDPELAYMSYDPDMPEDLMEAWVTINADPDFAGIAKDAVPILQPVLDNEVHVGSDAVINLISLVLKKHMLVPDLADDEWISNVIDLIGQVQCLGNNMAPHVIKTMHSRSTITKSILGKVEARYYQAAAHMGDILATQVGSADVARDNACARKNASDANFKSKKMRSYKEIYDEMEPLDKFKVRHKGFLRNVPGLEVWNMAGTILIKRFKTYYLMTRDHLTLLRTRLRSIANLYIGFCDFRLSANHHDYHKEAGMMFRHVARLIDDGGRPEAVARHLHVIYYQLLLIAAGQDHHELDAKAKEYIAIDTMAFYNTIKVPLRTLIDFSKIYHILPSPDIELDILWEKTKNTLHNENKYDKETLKMFIDFCKSYDFCRYLCKNSKAPKHVADEKYDYESTEWYKSCIRGNFKMPEKYEWGKIQIRGEYSYMEYANEHLLEAEDVTYVPMQIHKIAGEDKFHASELLHAVFDDPVTSLGRDIREARNDFLSPKFDKKVYLTVAGKAENTKFGKHVRPTYSASDEFREIFSEIEKNLQPIAALHPGISLRANVVKLEKQFRLMARLTKTSASDHNFFMSGDVSGWSDKYPRAVFYAHLELLLSYFDRPNLAFITRAWENINLVLNKRERFSVEPMNTGNFQGFPGTHDSILHAHLMTFWMHKAKIDKIFPGDCHIWTLVLIDDMVASISSSRKLPDDFLSRAREYARVTYEQLGFELDIVKTIVSRSLFIYLNRIFADGAEVCTSLKTYAKIGPEMNRSLSTVFERNESIAATARAAIQAGYDPFSCYFNYLYQCLKEISRLVPQVARSDLAKVAIFARAPRTEGGWGLSSLVELCTSENRDKSAQFNHELFEFFRIVTDPSAANALVTIKTQPYKKVTRIALLKNPFQTVRSGVEDPAMARSSLIRKLIKRIGPNKVYKGLLDDNLFSELEAIYDSFGATTHIDASLCAEFFANSPDCYIDSILAKIERSEVLLPFASRREIGSCLDLIRFREVEQLMHLLSFPPTEAHIVKKCMDTFLETCTSRYTDSERCYFGDFNQVYLANAVVNAPLAILGHTEFKDNAENRIRAEVRLSELIPVANGGPVDAHDCKTKDLPFFGAYTAGVCVYEGLAGRGLMKLDTMIQRQAFLIRLVEDRGSSCDNLKELFSLIWGQGLEYSDFAPSGNRFSGSFKRFPAAPGSRNHFINCFRNATGICTLDFREAVLIMKGMHTSSDLFSTSIAMRTAAMLEAVSNGKDFKIDFVIRAENLLDTWPIAAETVNEFKADKYSYQGFIKLFGSDKLAKLTDPTYREALLSIYTTQGMAAVEDMISLIAQNEQAGIEFMPEYIPVEFKRPKANFFVDSKSEVSFFSAGMRSFAAESTNASGSSTSSIRKTFSVIDQTRGSSHRALAYEQAKAFIMASITKLAKTNVNYAGICSMQRGEEMEEYAAAVKYLTEIPKDAWFTLSNRLGLQSLVEGLKRMGFQLGNTVGSFENMHMSMRMFVNRARAVRIWSEHPYGLAYNNSYTYERANQNLAIVANKDPEVGRRSLLKASYQTRSVTYFGRAEIFARELRKDNENMRNNKKPLGIEARRFRENKIIEYQIKGRIITSIRFDKKNNIDWYNTVQLLFDSVCGAIINHKSKQHRGYRRTPPEFEPQATTSEEAFADAEAIIQLLYEHYSLEEYEVEILSKCIMDVITFYSTDIQRPVASISDILPYESSDTASGAFESFISKTELALEELSDEDDVIQGEEKKEVNSEFQFSFLNVPKEISNDIALEDTENKTATRAKLIAQFIAEGDMRSWKLINADIERGVITEASLTGTWYDDAMYEQVYSDLKELEESNEVTFNE